MCKCLPLWLSSLADSAAKDCRKAWILVASGRMLGYSPLTRPTPKHPANCLRGCSRFLSRAVLFFQQNEVQYGAGKMRPMRESTISPAGEWPAFADATRPYERPLLPAFLPATAREPRRSALPRRYRPRHFGSGCVGPGSRLRGFGFRRSKCQPCRRLARRP